MASPQAGLSSAMAPMISRKFSHVEPMLSGFQALSRAAFARGNALRTAFSSPRYQDSVSSIASRKIVSGRGVIREYVRRSFASSSTHLSSSWSTTTTTRSVAGSNVRPQARSFAGSVSSSPRRSGWGVCAGSPDR